MSESPAPDTAETVDGALARMMVGTLRGFAAAYLVTTWAMLLVSQIEGMDLGLSFGMRLGVAIGITVLNAGMLLAPLDELAGTRQGQRLVEGYALANVLLYAVVHLGPAASPVFPMAIMVVVALGAITARPPVVLLLAFSSTLVIVVGATRPGAPDNFLTLAQSLLLLAVVWITSSVGRSHRATLQEAMDARAVATEHARQLAVVADAARNLQTLEPQVLLQTLVDATEGLGWDAAGIYVPGAEGDGAVLGAHRGLPPEVTEGNQTPVGIYGEIARTGRPVAWPDYASKANANPLDRGLTASAAGAPILVHNIQRGALVTSSRVAREITEQDRQTLELLASQAGRALEIADAFERQEQTVVELERVNALKQDFLATVSHELRTPLAVVLGMAETMDLRWDQMPEQMRREMTTRMHTNAAGLEHVIEALLDFSRLERGIVQPRRKDVALLDLVEEVVARLGPLLAAHKVVVQAAADGGRGEAWADPLLIERVVENLIVNASRHTPVGTSVRILVLHDGPNAVVEVADDGPGIPAEEVAHLGERFFRGGDVETRSTRGLGLGLAFCGEVLAMHDSQLEIDSLVGVGTRFSFALARGRTGDR